MEKPLISFIITYYNEPLDLMMCKTPLLLLLLSRISRVRLCGAS